MTLKHKIISGLVAAALLLGLVRYCDRDRVAPTEPNVLAPNERERIEVKGRTVTVIGSDRTTRTFAPNGVTVSVRRDGTVKVDVKKIGFTRELGLGVALTGESKLKVSLDYKLAYYRRLGFHLGATFDHHVERAMNIARPMAIISYSMPSEKFSNTSLFAGTELFPSCYVVGLRLAF